MTRDEFQRNVLSEIKRELEAGNVPIARMRELAGAALDLGQKYPSDIPDSEALGIVRRFSEMTSSTTAEIRDGMKAADESKIDEIRRSMGLRP